MNHESRIEQRLRLQRQIAANCRAGKRYLHDIQHVHMPVDMSIMNQLLDEYMALTDELDAIGGYVAEHE